MERSGAARKKDDTVSNPTRKEDNLAGIPARTKEELNGSRSTGPDPKESRLGRNCSAEPLSMEYKYGRKPTDPKPDRPRRIWTRAKPAQFEIEVNAPQYAVGAGDHEVEAKQAQ